MRIEIWNQWEKSNSATIDIDGGIIDDNIWRLIQYNDTIVYW